MALRKLVVGNWKMHGTSADLAEVKAIASAAKDNAGVDVGLCVPATLIHRAAESVPDFPIGGQDVHHAEKGAHTGCSSAKMLLDAGAQIVIVGHSERRAGQHESDEEVRCKAEAGLNAGLLTILCVGESLTIREGGDAVATVERQLDASLPRGVDVQKLAVAYEPIWAIGTGLTATIDDIAEMDAALRQRLTAAYGEAGANVRLLYGGSVNARNAAEIFTVSDGALVGGASLQSADFVPIIEAAAAAAA
jgi:triosephosphate isomerase